METDPLAQMADTLAAIENGDLAGLDLDAIATQIQELGDFEGTEIGDLLNEALANMQEFQDAGGLQNTGPTDADQAAIEAAFDEMMEHVMGFAYQMIDLQQNELKQLLDETARL